MVDPISTKIHAHHSAKELYNNDGVPSKIVMDSAGEQIMGKFKEACQYTTVQLQQLEYNNPWEEYFRFYIPVVICNSIGFRHGRILDTLIVHAGNEARRICIIEEAPPNPSLFQCNTRCYQAFH